MENEILIKQLNILKDYAVVNEIPAIVDVANNAITAIERLTRERDELWKDFNELDLENLAMLRDMELLSDIHAPCVICNDSECKSRNPDVEMRCADIMWRGVCEENCGGGQ